MDIDSCMRCCSNSSTCFLVPLSSGRFRQDPQRLCTCSGWHLIFDPAMSSTFVVFERSRTRERADTADIFRLVRRFPIQPSAAAPLFSTKLLKQARRAASHIHSLKHWLLSSSHGASNCQFRTKWGAGLPPQSVKSRSHVYWYSSCIRKKDDVQAHQRP